MINVGSDIQRFLDAQASVYNTVLDELNHGRKRTHWMWFIFPQVAGLGESDISKYYSIKSLEHASHYVAHPILGSRLLTCTQLVNRLQNRSATAIFGSVDALKLRSSMTLFSVVLPKEGQFREALDIFFAGTPDEVTLRIAERWRR